MRGPARAPSRRPNRAQERKRAARRQAAWRRALMVLLVAGLAAVGVSLIAVSRDGGREEAAPPQGTRSFDVDSRDHVPGSVAYPQTPPVGGDHNPVWQNCGYYAEEIPAEQGVHSLEHGAVWITYQPGIPEDQREDLRALANGEPNLLVSAWPDDLPATVVASAWGRQLALSSAADPRLDEFLRAFVKGPQTPEPGAPCSGGVGDPA